MPRCGFPWKLNIECWTLDIESPTAPLRPGHRYALLGGRMSTAHETEGFQVFSLTTRDGRTRAEIVPELGGSVSSLHLPGHDGTPREILYRHPWFWSRHTDELRGGIPLLFPICGRLLQDGTPGRYHVHDQPYALPIHGFACRLPWEVVDARVPDALKLRLTDSPATRAQYPFVFELHLNYTVADAQLICQFTVHNPGSAPLPYYAGFHPYFATPPPGEGKEQTRYQAAPQQRHVYNSTFTDLVGTAPTPCFPLSVSDPGLNEMLWETGDAGETRLTFPDGFALVQKADPILPYRQLYTLPDRPFFCDEPWMAPPGSLHYPGAHRLLLPDQTESATVRIARG